MQIESTRFGAVEVRDDAVLDVPGRADRAARDAVRAPRRRARFALLLAPLGRPRRRRRPGDEPVAVLRLVRGARVRRGRRAASSSPTRTTRTSSASSGATEQLEDFSVNLAAPVVLHTNNRLGRQIINDAHGYAVREPLFARGGAGRCPGNHPSRPGGCPGEVGREEDHARHHAQGRRPGPPRRRHHRHGAGDHRFVCPPRHRGTRRDRRVPPRDLGGGPGREPRRRGGQRRPAASASAFAPRRNDLPCSRKKGMDS